MLYLIDGFNKEIAMQKYKLVVSDLDGTLLSHDMVLTDENIEAIKAIKESGAEFVASSGRTLYEIPRCILDNEHIRYIGYSNGTAVYDKALKRDIMSSRISNSVVKSVIDIVNDYEIALAIHHDGYSYFEKNNTTLEACEKHNINPYYREVLLKTHLIENVRAKALSSDGVEAIVMFFADDRELDLCRTRLEALGTLTVTSSVEHNIEVCSNKAGKGAALTFIRDMLGIDKDAVIAVGDNMNDTSMFEVAGLSLCTSNGSAEAKSYADEVICSVNENTAKYIYDTFIK